eukprot:227668_1
MAQLAHSIKGKKKQKTRKNNLGTAPNDIYSLSDEIQRIKRKEKKSKPKPPQTEPTYAVYDDMKEAKDALTKGESIRYMFPKDVSSEEIVRTAKSFGLNTTKLVKVLGSSMVIKKLIDSYVQRIKSNNKYDGYLKHCTEVKALTYDKEQLMPRFQVKLNLDYDTYYAKDDQFKTKFAKELCGDIFRCPPEKLQIVSVKEGSIMIGLCIGLIALAIAGVIGITLNMNKKKNRMPRHNVCGGEEQEFHLGQTVMVQKRRKKMSATVVSPLALNKNDDRVVKVRYDDKKEEEFSLNDESLTAVEPGQDPDIEASVHINEGGVYIEAKKRKRWLW